MMHHCTMYQQQTYIYNDTSHKFINNSESLSHNPNISCVLQIKKIAENKTKQHFVYIQCGWNMYFVLNCVHCINVTKRTEVLNVCDEHSIN